MIDDNTLTPERIDELLTFLPIFSKEDYQFVVGVIDAGYPRYSADVHAFFNAVSQPWWLDFDYLAHEASNKISDDGFIQTANLDEIKTMLTLCLRSERFGDGNWESFLKKGRIQAILRRLREIKEAY